MTKKKVSSENARGKTHRICCNISWFFRHHNYNYNILTTMTATKLIKSASFNLVSNYRSLSFSLSLSALCVALEPITLHHYDILWLEIEREKSIVLWNKLALKRSQQKSKKASSWKKEIIAMECARDTD